MWTSDPDAQHYTIFSCSGQLQDDVCHVSVDFSVHMCAALFVCFTRVIVVPILLLCTQYWCPVSGACQDCNEMALIYFRCRSVVTVSTTVPAFDTSHEWMTWQLSSMLPCLAFSCPRCEDRPLCGYSFSIDFCLQRISASDYQSARSTLLCYPANVFLVFLFFFDQK